MRRMSLLIVVIVSGFVAGSLLLEASGDLSNAAVETIDRQQLRSALYFLASDSMGGRDTASPGNEISAAYLAHRFELMGLEPAGDNGTYFQSVGLATPALGEANRFLMRTAAAAVQGVSGETFYPSPLSASARATAPAVFAGYGITAPEYGYDDYRGLPAAGKIVVVFDGEPSSDEAFLGNTRTEHARPFHKIITAQKQGAAGLVLLRAGQSRDFNRAARSTWPSESRRKRFHLTAWSESVTIPVVYASLSEIEPLAGGPGSLSSAREGIDNSLRNQSRPLANVEITLETTLTSEVTSVSNVIARIPGSDPSLADEAVIVSAHFDHVGVRGEQIFNGADDDASGTVAVLEIAEAFALSDTRPRRPVLFALWNAEERGLLGSRHYLHDPDGTRPEISALFQLDMVGRNEEVPDGQDRRFRGLQPQSASDNEDTVHVIGYSFSDDMKDLVVAGNESTDLRLKFELDDHPISLLTRSDHWPFLAAGIPAIFFTSGLHPDYHQPTDTAEKINYAKLEKIARLAFVCAWNSANRQAKLSLGRRAAEAQ